MSHSLFKVSMWTVAATERSDLVRYGLRMTSGLLMTFAGGVILLGQERLSDSTLTAQSDPHSSNAKQYRTEVVGDPNEIPVVEKTVSLKGGGELSLCSVKRHVVNAVSHETYMDRHMHVLWLDYSPGHGGMAERVWSFSALQQPLLLLDYTAPYGFSISTDAAPVVALAFLDDKLAYFVELDLHGPRRLNRASEERIGLSHFLWRRIGSANFEPRFAIEELGRRDDRWFMRISTGGHETTFIRTGANSWVETPLFK